MNCRAIVRQRAATAAAETAYPVGLGRAASIPTPCRPWTSASRYGFAPTGSTPSSSALALHRAADCMALLEPARHRHALSERRTNTGREENAGSCHSDRAPCSGEALRFWGVGEPQTGPSPIQRSRCNLGVQARLWVLHDHVWHTYVTTPPYVTTPRSSCFQDVGSIQLNGARRPSCDGRLARSSTANAPTGCGGRI